MVVGSYGAGGDCTLTLDLKKLGLPDTVQAKNGETGEPIKSAGAGVFVFPIKKHDFQVLQVEPTQPQ